MPQPGVTVIKIGGSLFDWPELPERLMAFLAGQGGWLKRGAERVLLMAGGGRFADQVRELDRIQGLGDEISHRLAVETLDVTADLLASLLPGSITIQRPESLDSHWNAGLIPILAPRRFLVEIDDRSADPLPRSWDVTSDSIAARIADRWGAGRLILLKSAPLPEGDVNREAAARLGLVDPMFPRVAMLLPRVDYVAFRQPASALRELPP